MGNDFKAILTESSGAISGHLKLSWSFTALVVSPLSVVRGSGTMLVKGQRKSKINCNISFGQLCAATQGRR